MDMRIDSQEQEDLVVNNWRLVYYIVKKMGLSNSDYEDYVSIGTIGLIKAAKSFDSSKNIKFSTYASKCIKNELLMYFRKEKQYPKISLDEPISTNNEGNNLSLADIIPSSDSDFLEKMEENKILERIISIILNLLEGKERLIILYEIGGGLQREISEKINCSQSYISRLENKIKKKIKSYFDTTQQFKEVFSMSIVDDLYKITFSSKEIKHFNKIFARLLLDLKSATAIPNFKISCNNERIIIHLPANSKSFSFIAQIIQEIDNFSISFESNENSLHIGDNEVSNITAEPTKEVRKSVVDEDKKDPKLENDIELDFDEEVKETESPPSGEDLPKADTNLTDPKESKVKKIRDYILSIESFTTKELRKQFPEFTNITINNAIYLAKKKGLIVSTEKGKYIVNKD